MRCIILINNSTSSTPEIISAGLTGSRWLPGFSLVPPVPIRPYGQKVGWVEGDHNYQIKLSTRFYLYDEDVDTTITITGDTVKIDSSHTNNIINIATHRQEDGEIVVDIRYETWDSMIASQPITPLKGGRGKVIIRAGTVSSLIKKIKNEGGRAHGISVNESTDEYTNLDDFLQKGTNTGKTFKTSKYVGIGWKNNIEKKRGKFRKDPLPDNKFHSLMDNLEAKKVGGVFQQMLNPHYDPNCDPKMLEDDSELQ